MVQLTETQEQTINEVMKSYNEGHRSNIAFIVYNHPDWPAYAVQEFYECM